MLICPSLILRTYGIASAILGLMVAVSGQCDESSVLGDKVERGRRQYTYSWMFADGGTMKPRGATTKGPEVTLQRGSSAAWRALQSRSLSSFKRDRLAILAMQGAYRVTFDFIETVGFTEYYRPAKPYQSWGTEHVYVVADEAEYISLQHILVMRFLESDGTVSDPVVVKHWRQDWRYEHTELSVFAGRGTWQRISRPRSTVRGAWSRAVFQVDDSPRYEVIGRWRHDRSYSVWTGESAWRPLPRREFSVRDDYHVLETVSQISIVPSGWVQDDDALKLVLDADGLPDGDMPYLAREAGISRYERIVDYDFAAGDAYWEKTASFWAEVRAAWREIRHGSERFTILHEVDGNSLSAAMLNLAEQHRIGASDPAVIPREVRSTLQRFID